jgi:hypothetical protein
MGDPRGMATAGARPRVPAAPRVPAVQDGPGLHIESLRVRIVGRDADDGRRFASELERALVEHGPKMLAGISQDSAPLEGMKLLVRSTDAANAPQLVASAVARAIARAVAGRSRGSGH